MPSTDTEPASGSLSEKNIHVLYDSIIYIGRFEPFHSGHCHVAEHAFEKTNFLIMVIGSKNKSRTTKNPFDYKERKEIISLVLDQRFPKTLGKQYAVIGQDDCENDQQWVSEICEQVKTQQMRFGLNPESGKHRIIGYSKDESSYYLESFPQWKCIQVKEYRYLNKITSATDIRRILFKSTNEQLSEKEQHELEILLTKPVVDWIDAHKAIIDECH